nr:MAG TPA: tail tube protein [Caudoviricetes sp.]
MADLTTLGVTVHYGVETVKGTKPTTFTWLKRCSAIGGISLDTEQIDVSALEDYITQYAAGRQDTGGTWELTFNLNADVITAIKKLFADAKTAKGKEFRVWFEVVFPDLADAFFVVAEPGREIPLPEIGQNEAATLPLTLIINEYKGLDTKVVTEEVAQSLDNAKAAVI